MRDGERFVGLVRGQFAEALQEEFALAVDVADGHQRGVRAQFGEDRVGQLGRVAPVAAQVHHAPGGPGRWDAVAGALGGVADQQDRLRVQVGDDRAHLPVAFHPVRAAVDDDVERAADRAQVLQLTDVHHRRLGVVGGEDIGEAQPLAVRCAVALDGEHTGVRRGVPHTAQCGVPVHAEQFRHRQRDGDVLLEGEPAEPAQLLVGDRLRIDRYQPATPLVRLLLEDAQPVPLGGDADPADRHRPAQRAGHIVQRGPHLLEVVLADVAQHADGGMDQLLLVDLLKCRHHRHALDHQGVRPVGRRAPDDADLFHDIGDAEFAVHRLLGGIRVDEPGRGAGGLGDGGQTAAAQRPRAQPGDGTLSADAVDQHPGGDLRQRRVVASLFQHTGHQEHRATQQQHNIEEKHVS